MDTFIPKEFVEASRTAFKEWLDEQNRAWRREAFSNGTQYSWADNGKRFAFEKPNGTVFVDPNL